MLQYEENPLKRDEAVEALKVLHLLMELVLVLVEK